ncbi:MAG: hypothetical protein U9Q63_03475 [Patescibacteria group bacterium]|nr:hypothetical protein [Patescibacteria group bacterium]
MTARAKRRSLVLRVGLVILVFGLMGAKCSKSKTGQDDLNNFKQVAVTDLYGVFQKTANQLGLEADLVEIDKEHPTQMIYNGFRIMSIKAVRVDSKLALKSLASSYGLKSFELDSFINDLCNRKKNEYGAAINVFEISDYQTCGYSGESKTGAYAGSVILVGNYILTSDKPPPKRKDVLNEETGVYEQVIVEGWSWDHQGATQTFVNNFLEKYK